jgi:hypothetical protein
MLQFTLISIRDFEFMLLQWWRFVVAATGFGFGFATISSSQSGRLYPDYDLDLEENRCMILVDK